MNAFLVRTYHHMAWADRKMISVLAEQEKAGERARVLLAHLVAAECIWLKRIEMQEVGSLTPWTELSLRECAEMAAMNHAGYLRILDGLTDEKMASRIGYVTTRGDAMATCLGDILMHVALHGSYHRGQIAADLKAQGVAPPATDYVLYCRQLQLGDA